MDRGAWWVTVHEVAKSDTTECLTLSVFSRFVQFSHNSRIENSIQVPIDYKVGDTGTYPGA